MRCWTSRSRPNERCRPRNSPCESGETPEAERLARHSVRALAALLAVNCPDGSRLIALEAISSGEVPPARLCATLEVPIVRKIRRIVLGYPLASGSELGKPGDTPMATLLDSSETISATIYDILLEARDSFEKETRSEMRYPYYRPLLIKAGDALRSGFSREISQTGIGLLHRYELLRDEVLVTIASGQSYSVNLRTQILWCHPLGEGWFVSGGEFLDVAALDQ